ncbi:MAG: hypothetical protein U0892_01255 [Pirellulales bacterium]
MVYIAFSRLDSVVWGQEIPFQPSANISEFGLPDPRSNFATDPLASLEMQATRTDEMHLAAEMPLSHPYNPAPAHSPAGGMPTQAPPNIDMEYGQVTRPDFVWNEVPRYRSGNLLQRIWRDHRAFYSADSLALLRLGWASALRWRTHSWMLRYSRTFKHRCIRPAATNEPSRSMRTKNWGRLLPLPVF